MTEKLAFLPAFNAAHIENYFYGDTDSVREIFRITNDHIDNDLERITSAVNNADIAALQDILHSIKPVFGFIGLSAAASAINDLHELCLQYAPDENIRAAYVQLRPVLADARQQIASQYSLFGLPAGQD